MPKVTKNSLHFYVFIFSHTYRYDGSNDLTTGEYYNPAANTWSAITPMGTRRSCLGICAYDGLIYCVGGYDGASCLSSVERYDPLTAMWTSCPAMNTKRRYCRSVVLGKRTHIIDMEAAKRGCLLRLRLFLGRQPLSFINLISKQSRNRTTS